MLFSIPLNSTKMLSTLTTLLKQEPKVINRGGEKKKSPQQAMLSLPNGSYNAAEQKKA